MRSIRSSLAALVVALLAPILSRTSTAVDERTPLRERQSVASARDLYRRAILGFENGDEDALSNLGKACRIFEIAVEGDPTDVELFVERCRARRLLAEKRGAIDERSVEKSLNWIASKRNRGGNWLFFLDDAAASKANLDASPIRATSIALLPYLGAGRSHKHGEFRYEIEAAATYIVSESRQDTSGIDFRGPSGDIVAHAMATWVLCEAYEATDDRRLEGPAQEGVKFLESLQDQEDGGWGVVGDDAPKVTVTAWCVLALQAAKRANLAVEPNTVRLVERFLVSRHTEGGAFFGDVKPGKQPRATAAGLLCRCLLGHDASDATIVKGAEYLAEPGTIGNDAEARFLATQVILHVGGDLWRKWSRVTREMLVNAQQQDGDRRVSWYFANDVAAKTRGRLWHTALSTLNLEVFYRYLVAFKSADQRGLVELKSGDSKK